MVDHPSWLPRLQPLSSPWFPRAVGASFWIAISSWVRHPLPFCYARPDWLSPLEAGRCLMLTLASPTPQD